MRLCRAARRAALLAGGLFLVGALLEAGLRFVLFSDAARDWGIGWRLRHEGLYCAHESGREFWKLRALLGTAPANAQLFDARLGWRNASFDADTLAHEDEQTLGARTPVLLFGDSYAHCVEPPRDCWQGLLERSPLAARYALLNYGVGGYGLDQALLLMRLALPRFEARAPVVVMGVLVDDDLDRCYLALRDGPKPYFTLADGELVLHPPEAPDPASFVRAHPLEIRSYLWRLFTFQSGLVARDTAIAWAGEGEHVAEKQALAARLIHEVRGELEPRGLAYFFVLFHARGTLAGSGPSTWQEAFLLDTLARERIPFVSSRPFLEAEMQRTGAAPESFFHEDGPGINHYTAAANAVVFEAIAAGLEGRFEPPSDGR